MSAVRRAAPRTAQPAARSRAAANNRYPLPREGGRGEGSPIAAKLAHLGIRTQADLVLHLPLRYEDETRLTAIADLRPGVAAQVEAEIVDASVQYRPRRQLVVRVQDASGELVLRFLNFYGSQQKQLAVGRRLRIFGEPRGGFLGDEMVHPRYRLVGEEEALPEAMTPIYPTTAGLSQLALRKCIDLALKEVDLGETLPDPLRKKLSLAVFSDSVELLHHPTPAIPLAELSDRAHPAWQRIKFDELLAQQLSLRRAHEARRAKTAPPLPAKDTKGALTKKLLAALPFRLTAAQQRVWREIAADLGEKHPMQRLLQGDVGSGKTVVAALAMLAAAENGHQAVLMAPTEILAEQHWRKLSQWLAPLNLSIAWLSGSLKKKEKAAMAEAIASGRAPLAIGTHALIEEAIDFSKLGLAIIDEQHRFGVHQRLTLREKGKNPHQLMMSATPIPRTLAMSYYADLDVSVIDELPPGRQPVLTKLVSEARRDEVVARIRDACAQGRQAYWVCPLIEESEKLQLRTAVDTFERLRAELPELSVGLVHGRLKGEEKAAVMGGFAAGKVQLLVATTVIEVGVDVPNASLMVVEHAERFGLSQLHQLRGRVGRGADDSVCILLYAHPLGETARARLKVIFENADGFEIARQDLHLRGPGEFLGSRQSGVPLLRYADLEADAELIEAARETAERLLKDYPEAADRHVERWLGGRKDLLKV
ncbi:MAG: ATP-dependent DNA helicase RecG [Rhodocyclaceae bacterium]|nr:ATP-dependent DNA helicase RecG [Rhodocyclaceae bacterium]